MKRMTIAKSLADAIARGAQALETAARGDDNDVVLDGFGRVVQLANYSCGAQSAFMILRYFGKARSIERTIKLLGTDADGTAWLPMRSLFLQRGLLTKVTAAGMKQVIRTAIDAGSPLLVTVDEGSHWATLYGYGPGRVYVADPSLGRAARVICDWSTFKKRWDRWAALVSRS